MTAHISKLDIKTYRGLKNFEISDIGQFNVFVGDNNSGKTSVLEVIRILSQPSDIGNILKVAFSRKNRVKQNDFIDTALTIFQKETPLEYENKNMRDVYSLEMSSIIDNNHVSLEIFAELSKKLNFSSEVDNSLDSVIDGSIKVTRDSNKPEVTMFTVESNSKISVDTTEEIYKAVFMPVSVNLYGSCVTLYPEVIKTEKKDIFIEVLQIFDKNIYDISIVEEMIWVHHRDKETMPLFSYGSGMQKALLMSIVLVMSKDGVLLIDEVETALHTLALKEVFSFLFKACKKMNVQLFATTHSIEAVDKILSTAKSNGSLDDVRIITIKKNVKLNKTLARVLNGSVALEDRENYAMELRI